MAGDDGAETKADAELGIDAFVAEFEAKYPKAATCLAQDREAAALEGDLVGLDAASASSPTRAMAAWSGRRPRIAKPDVRLRGGVKHQ